MGKKSFLSLDLMIIMIYAAARNSKLKIHSLTANSGMSVAMEMRTQMSTRAV